MCCAENNDRCATGSDEGAGRGRGGASRTLWRLSRGCGRLRSSIPVPRRRRRPAWLPWAMHISPALPGSITRTQGHGDCDMISTVPQFLRYAADRGGAAGTGWNGPSLVMAWQRSLCCARDEPCHNGERRETAAVWSQARRDAQEQTRCAIMQPPAGSFRSVFRGAPSEDKLQRFIARLIAHCVAG